MRSRVASGIKVLPLKARETVDEDTPAMRAMSIIWVRRGTDEAGLMALIISRALTLTWPTGDSHQKPIKKPPKALQLWAVSMKL
jgi:hypothetical protein